MAGRSAKPIPSGCSMSGVISPFEQSPDLPMPFFTQMALSYVPALRGGVALVATLVGLLITAWVTDGLSISGATTWIAATVIVWIVSLIGVLLLPLILVKKKVQENRS